MESPPEQRKTIELSASMHAKQTGEGGRGSGGRRVLARDTAARVLVHGGRGAARTITVVSPCADPHAGTTAVHSRRARERARVGWVCVCVYVCMHARTYVHKYIRTYVFVFCVCLCVCVCIRSPCGGIPQPRASAYSKTPAIHMPLPRCCLTAGVVLGSHCRCRCPEQVGR